MFTKEKEKILDVLGNINNKDLEKILFDLYINVRIKNFLSDYQYDYIQDVDYELLEKIYFDGKFSESFILFVKNLLKESLKKSSFIDMEKITYMFLEKVREDIKIDNFIKKEINPLLDLVHQKKLKMTKKNKEKLEQMIKEDKTYIYNKFKNGGISSIIKEFY